MSTCRKKQMVSAKTTQGGKNQCDLLGCEEDRLHFLAQELCRLYERYDEYSKQAPTTFSHIVRELLGLYFGQNNRPGSAGLKSVKARAIVAGKKNGKTVSDHVVPLRVIQDCLLAIVKECKDGKKAIEEVKGFLQRNAFVVRISEEEHDQLKTLELHEEMPDGWQDGDSPWERYSEAKIKVVDRTGKEVI